jgi:hypothetical protein
VERASLARPTLIGVHDRALATVAKLCSSSCSESGVGWRECRSIAPAAMRPRCGLKMLVRRFVLVLLRNPASHARRSVRSTRGVFATLLCSLSFKRSVVSGSLVLAPSPIRPFADTPTRSAHFPSSAFPGSSTRSVVSTMSSAGHPSLINP